MNADIIVPIIIAVVAAAPGALALWRQFRQDKQNRPQDEMTEGVQTSKTASEVVREYAAELRLVRAEMRELRKEMDCLHDLMEQWQAGIKVLIAQIFRMGGSPDWEPKTQPLKPTQ